MKSLLDSNFFMDEIYVPCRTKNLIRATRQIVGREMCNELKAILRLFIYKALYDQSYLGSKTTMTTGEWSCLISFAWDSLTCSERRGGSENENICLHWDSNPRLATTRPVEQRFRPLGYDTLMKILLLISYLIVG